MARSILRDRAIIDVTGDDAESLLHRLFTRNMLGMATGMARYAALLSPQGKVLIDFLVYRHDGGFWLDVAGDQAADLARKLTLFKLRAKVTIEARADLAVAVAWGDAPVEMVGAAFPDPRHAALGSRIVASPENLRAFGSDPDSYDAHRIALGIPQGGVDFVYGDTFVHDANLDLLHGVDFDKGCYVGQEVVSRVHHRGSARKRVVKVHFYGDSPAPGAALTAGQSQIGQITSLAGADGLASARVDRLADAETSHVPILAGETLVAITLPDAGVVDTPSGAMDVPGAAL